MIPVAEIVDTAELLSSVVAALVAAILFTLAVSLAIRGAARYVDYGSEGRVVAATVSLALSVLFGVLAIALVATGLYLLISS